ncbi:hypothetical protein CEY11_14360 [Candidimonas nitroreducens]|uniref:DUF4148 domain-containing protein n=2 Tax=Candidimonas nitroreducens TaxID=683354 RepID=A0A225MA42_9BURK|nr:hypothetical protein CEY11_14360 [Candidimonas nitroreducens]
MEFDMKALASALMISATLIAGAAQAASVNDAPKTRAQVQAELVAAQAAGQIQTGEFADYPVAVQQASTTNRAQVQSELAAAEAAGQIESGEFADYPLAVASSAPSHVTRAEVEAEYTKLASAGQLPQVAF